MEVARVFLVLVFAQAATSLVEAEMSMVDESHETAKASAIVRSLLLGVLMSAILRTVHHHQVVIRFGG